MNAEEAWNHDPYFVEMDRWMYEPDTANWRDSWQRQGQAWDAFVNEMWAKYRTGPDMPPTDGWKKPHDDSYLKNAIEKAGQEDPK